MNHQSLGVKLKGITVTLGKGYTAVQRANRKWQYLKHLLSTGSSETGGNELEKKAKEIKPALIKSGVNLDGNVQTHTAF